MGMDAFKFPKETPRAWKLLKYDGEKKKPMATMHYVDHFSGKSFVYSMPKEDSNTTMVTLKYPRREAGLPRLRITWLRITWLSDNLGNNTGKPVEQFLALYGVYDATTGADSPWQNGICKGKHKVVTYVMDKICVTFQKDIMAGVVTLGGILQEAIASVDELSGPANVEYRISYELWFGRLPPGYPSVDRQSPCQLNVTDDPCDQVRMHIQLRVECGKEAHLSKSSALLRDTFREILKPSKGPLLHGDMVYYWAGQAAEGRDIWNGPGEIALIDRSGNARVKNSGQVYIHCPELLGQEVSQPGIRNDVIMTCLRSSSRTSRRRRPRLWYNADNVRFVVDNIEHILVDTKEYR